MSALKAPPSHCHSSCWSASDSAPAEGLRTNALRWWNCLVKTSHHTGMAQNYQTYIGDWFTIIERMIFDTIVLSHCHIILLTLVILWRELSDKCKCELSTAMEMLQANTCGTEPLHHPECAPTNHCPCMAIHLSTEFKRSLLNFAMNFKHMIVSMPATNPLRDHCLNLQRQHGHQDSPSWLHSKYSIELQIKVAAAALALEAPAWSTSWENRKSLATCHIIVWFSKLCLCIELPVG